MSANKSIVVAALWLLTSTAWAGLPVDIVLRPRPQAYTDTCQSYGLALAAASVPDTPLRADDAKELRTSEKELRAARDQVAKNAGKSPFDHSVWKDAIEKVSAGALTADVKYIQDYDEWVNEVKSKTGIENAQALGTVLTSALVKTPVLTSVESIGSNTYATGHIVTLMGVADANSSPVGLAVLNPAVKLGASPEKVVCELDDGPGDMKYQAFATIESTYRLKKFPSGYLLLTVRKR